MATVSANFAQRRSQSTDVGLLLALGANVLWGTSFLGSRLILAVWSPITATCLRFAVALLTMAVAFPLCGYRLTVPRHRSEMVAFVAIGICGFAVLYPLQALGLALTSSSLSAALMLTSPLLLMVIGTGFFGEAMRWNHILAILLGTGGGIVLVLGPAVSLKTGLVPFSGSAGFLTGVGCTLLSSVCLAVSTLLTRHLGKGIPVQDLTFWPILISMLFLVPFAIYEPRPVATELPGGGSHHVAIVSLLYLGTVCTAGGFLMWNKAATIGCAAEVALSMHIKTPVAIFLGTVLGGEPLGRYQVFGSLIVAVAVWLSQLSGVATREAAPIANVR